MTNQQIEESYPWMDQHDLIDEHWEGILAEWRPDPTEESEDE